MASTRHSPTRARPSDLVELTDAAMAIGLALVLGNLKLVELPAGGSISAGIVPLIALSIARGPKIGFIAGLCAGLAHALFGGVIVHPAQLLLDYGIAYAGLSVAGLPLLRGRWYGVVAASLVQLATFTVSGVLFFSPTMTSQLAWLLSLGYNAITVIPECFIALALVPLIVRAYARIDPQLAASAGRTPAAVSQRRRRRTPPPQRVAQPITAAALALPTVPATPRPGGSQHHHAPTPHAARAYVAGEPLFAPPSLGAAYRLDSRARPLGPLPHSQVS